jgi:hypothetical protein
MKEASTVKTGRAHAICDQDGLAVRIVRLSSQEISWMMTGENAKSAARSNREIRRRREANAPYFFLFHPQNTLFHIRKSVMFNPNKSHTITRRACSETTIRTAARDL